MMCITSAITLSNLLLLIVLYVNPMLIKSLLNEVLPPEKFQPLERDSTPHNRNELSHQIALCHKPVSSSMLDFLCFCIANESSVVWHLGQSCLHLCEYAGEHTSFLVLKNTLFSILGTNLSDRCFRDTCGKYYNTTASEISYH